MASVASELRAPLETAPRFTLGAAGAESNVAQYLAERGHSAAWAGIVGDDPLGRRLSGELGRCGVDLSFMAVDPAAPTGVMFKDPGAGSTRVHYYRANSAASRMGPEMAEVLPWRRTRFLHLSGITPSLSFSTKALMHALFARAELERVPVSFDVNFRPALWPKGEAAPVLLEFARRAALVFVGLDEAQSLWPGVETAADVRALVGGRGRLVVKDGAVGATEFEGQQSAFVPAAAVEVVEAVGAGDAFAAGYLSAVLDGGGPAGRLGRGHEFAGRALASTSDFQPIAERSECNGR